MRFTRVQVLIVAVVLCGCASRSLEGAGKLSFEEVMHRYRGYEPRKALAVALASDGRWAYGASEANLTQGRADGKALEQCRKTAAAVSVAAECRVYLRGEEMVWEGPSPK